MTKWITLSFLIFSSLISYAEDQGKVKLLKFYDDHLSRSFAVVFNNQFAFALEKCRSVDEVERLIGGIDLVIESSLDEISSNYTFEANNRLSCQGDNAYWKSKLSAPFKIDHEFMTVELGGTNYQIPMRCPELKEIFGMRLRSKAKALAVKENQGLINEKNPFIKLDCSQKQRIKYDSDKKEDGFSLFQTLDDELILFFPSDDSSKKDFIVIDHINGDSINDGGKFDEVAHHLKRRFNIKRPISQIDYESFESLSEEGRYLRLDWQTGGEGNGEIEEWKGEDGEVFGLLNQGDLKISFKYCEHLYSGLGFTKKSKNKIEFFGGKIDKEYNCEMFSNRVHVKRINKDSKLTIKDFQNNVKESESKNHKLLILVEGSVVLSNEGGGYLQLAERIYDNVELRGVNSESTLIEPRVILGSYLPVNLILRDLKIKIDDESICNAPIEVSDKSRVTFIDTVISSSSFKSDSTSLIEIGDASINIIRTHYEGDALFLYTCAKSNVFISKSSFTSPLPIFNSSFSFSKIRNSSFQVPNAFQGINSDFSFHSCCFDSGHDLGKEAGVCFELDCGCSMILDEVSIFGYKTVFLGTSNNDRERARVKVYNQSGIKDSNIQIQEGSLKVDFLGEN